MTNWDHITDVVVVGTGGGGMTAALVAAQAGLGTLMIEKTEYYAVRLPSPVVDYSFLVGFESYLDWISQKQGNFRQTTGFYSIHNRTPLHFEVR